MQPQPQLNRIQQMNNMMQNVRRDDGLSNLMALQQMRQMKQPQMRSPQMMQSTAPVSYNAQGGFPDLSGDGRITQKDILMGRGVVERKYGGGGGLETLPITEAFGGFNPFKPIKQAGRSVSKGLRGAGKAVSSGLSGIGDALGGLGSGDSGSFLKNLAIQLALTYAMGPAGLKINMAGLGPYGKAALRFGKGYLGSALSKGVPGVTKNLLDPSKLTSGAASAALGAVGDQFSPTLSGSLNADPNLVPVSGAELSGEYGTSELAKESAKKSFLESAKDSTMDFARTDAIKGLTYGDIGKAAVAAGAETTAQNTFADAKKLEQDARGAAKAFTDKIEGEQRTAAEFARLAMEDPVMYNYVYKYADDPETVKDIVLRMAGGADTLQDAQQFETATYTTESGRKPGELAAAQGGGISTIINNAIGQNQQFANGMVPNTVNSQSDGMSDSETMLITDKTGKKPTGIMKISEEEYVISAPDMALIGNGSARAGAQKVDNFREGLRQMAYGTKTHQPRIDGNKALQSLMRG
tara:strand:+ start:2523 stop:4094 length:1572 start_codon:yes stop_codon:yes gene_type:complete